MQEKGNLYHWIACRKQPDQLNSEDSSNPWIASFIEDTGKIRSLIWMVYFRSSSSILNILCLSAEGLNGPPCECWARIASPQRLKDGMVSTQRREGHSRWQSSQWLEDGMVSTLSMCWVTYMSRGLEILDQLFNSVMFISEFVIIVVLSG